MKKQNIHTGCGSTKRFSHPVWNSERRYFLLALGFLFIVTTVYFVVNKIQTKVEAGWWNDTWQYRKSITLTSGTAAVTDFQVLVQTSTSALISAGKLRSDCGDIRFTNATGKELPFWVEESGTNACNDTDTNIWVKVDNIPATGGTTIYMYYGNSSAINGNDGTNTFVFFDDFGDTNLNERKWNYGGTVTITGGAVRLAPGRLASRINMGQNVIVDARSRVTSTSYTTTNHINLGIIDSSQNDGNGFWGFYHNDNTWDSYWRNSSAWSLINTSEGSWTTSQWYRHRITKVASVYSWDVDGTNLYSGTHPGSPGTSTYLNASRVWTEYSNGDGPMEIDWVMARQYLATEPTVTINAEQQGTGPLAYYSFDEGYGTTVHNQMERNGENGLVGWWKFDEGADNLCTGGTNDICDSTQNNDGTNSSGSWGTGKSGNAITFNGSTTYAQIPDNDKIDFSTNQEFAVSFWMKNSNAVTSCIIEKWDGTGPYPYVFRQNSNLLRFAQYDGTNVPILDSTTTVTDNAWHHAVGTKNGSYLYLYIDGRLEATTLDTATETTTNSTPIYLGRRGDGSCSYSGSVDSLKIYNRSFSSSDVQAEYTSTHGHMINMDPASDWVEGARQNPNQRPLGKALDFDGSNDYVFLPDSSYLQPSRVSVSAWFKTSGTNSMVIVRKRYYGYNLSMGDSHFAAGPGQVSFKINDSGATDYYATSSETYNDNKWHHAVGTFDGTSVKLYIDGELSDSSPANVSMYYLADGISIGRDGTASADYFTGQIDEVKIYGSALLHEQIKTEYNRGAAVVMGAGVHAGQGGSGPIGWWKLDEGSGYSVYDSSGNNNNGVLTNASTSDWTNGKVGNGFDFDGTDDYIEVGDISSVDFGSGNFSLSAWVKRETTGVNTIIIGKDNSVAGTRQFHFQIASNNKARVSYFTATDSQVYLDSTTSIADSNWHHIVGQRNGNSLEIYLDGVLDASGTTSGSHGTMQATTANLEIGKRQYTTDQFNGVIDQVKIYNYARTPEQIHYDMATGSPIAYYSFNEGNNTTVHNLQEKNGENGLIGWWKMDEGADNLCTGGVNDVCDTTGNHDGVNSAATWTTSGKIGNALAFNGSSSYVDIADSSKFDVNRLTISAWVYSTNFNHNGFIFEKGPVNTQYSCFFNGTDTFYFRTRNSANAQDDLSFTTSSYFTNSAWNHVACTYDGAYKRVYVNGILAASKAYTQTLRTGQAGERIGAYGGGTPGYYFTGTIDSVRVYNRALSADEVAAQYNSLQGTMMNMTPASDWVEGAKPNLQQRALGKALDFDGSNDYVTLDSASQLNISGDMTISMWVKPATLPLSTNIAFIAKRPLAGGAARWHFGINDDLSGYNFYNGSAEYQSAQRPPVGVWSHVVMVLRSGINVKYYTNGLLVDTVNGASMGTATTDPVTIGKSGADTLFSGSMDEVKIYNYALTDNEIKTEFNRNAGLVLGAGKQTNEEKNALVGWWKMDEAGGYSLYDSSGKSNTAKITNMDSATDWVSGKLGKALAFDGTDDYAVTTNTLGISGAAARTFSFWFYQDSLANKNMLGYGANVQDQLFDIIVSGGNVYPHFYVHDGVAGAMPYSVGVWNHVAVTYDGTNVITYVNGKAGTPVAISLNTTDSTLEIGDGKYTVYNYFNGKIDNVKVFNKALSQAEVAYEYNQGAPIAHWRFDEKSGTTAYDESNNNLDGTLTLMDPASNWVTGKRNGAINLDGSNDYLIGTDTALPNGSNPRTISTWIRLAGQPANGACYAIFGYGTTTANNAQGISYCQISGAYLFRYFGWSNDFDFTQTLQTGQWYHYATTFDGTTAKMYLNGQYLGSSNRSTWSTTRATNFYIGQNLSGGSNFNGDIDELKVYNYALSAEQIKLDYNNNAAVRF